MKLPQRMQVNNLYHIITSMTNLMRSVRRVVAEESLRWVMPCQELTDLQIIGPIGRLSSGPKERFGFPSKCIDGGLNHL